MTNRQSSPFAAVLAVVAGVAGVATLVMAVVLFIDQIANPDPPDDSSVVAVNSVPTTETTTVILDSGTETTAAPTFDPGGTTLVTDDTGAMSIAIPSDWLDVSGTGWVIDGERVGPAITAAWNVDDWYSTWGTPGAFIGISDTGFEPQSGDFSSVCSPAETQELSAGSLIGTATAWSDCGAEGSDFHVLVAEPADSSYAVLIQLVTIDGSGAATLEGLMDTLSYQP